MYDNRLAQGDFVVTSDPIFDDVEDIELLDGIGNGDRHALTKLYDRYASHVMAITFHIIKNRQEAEDLVHDVFIEAWQNSKSYDSGRGSVRNWLLLRARSRSIDRIRKLARTETRRDIDEGDLPKLDCEADPVAVDPLRQLDHRQARIAIGMLSSEHALLIRASYFEDLTYREIAKKYEIPEGTVKSRMLAAFKILRSQLNSPMEVING
ncbi:MAG: sigma-70 family RNA polymerase sigma factor [Gammaproteobacteria bacterium]|nr:sigma-70 family RNA polymerase sigma factor [Gammaproteobacteria bacterium]